MDLREIFGLWCLATYAVNAWAAAHAKPRFADAVGVSVMFCMAYALSNTLVEVYGFPAGVMLWPVIDLVLLGMVARSWYKGRSWWKPVISALLVFQLISHVAFFHVLQVGGATQHSVYVYAVMMNVAFGLQLVTMGSVGIGHAMAVAFSGLLDRWRLYRVGHG
jgi:hypothetical protein